MSDASMQQEKTNYAGRSTRWRLLLGMSLLSTWACNELVGNPPPVSRPDDTSQGGENPTGGADSASGGKASSSGGEPNSGGGNTNAGGSPATSGGSNTGGTAGDPSVVLDGRCTKSGDRACDTQDSTQKLVCSQGFWASNGSCDSGDACDPESGQCAVIVAECQGLSPGADFCSDNDEVLTCGANLVTTTLKEACEGNCVATQAGAACAPGSCGDGKPQSGEDCDDGNANNNDECTELCQAPSCGDGFTNGSEACDDANQVETDGCRKDCTWGATNVSVGGGHSCAIFGDGRVKCWGDNSTGQLGIGDTSRRGGSPGEMGSNLPEVSLGTGRRALSLSAGGSHTCALLDDGSVKCWGDNYFGQLGQGDTEVRGDAPGEMGDALPPVSLGTGRTAKALAAAFRFTCALLDNNSIKCWGDNQAGQLGLGDTVSRGDNPDEMGDQLPAVALGTGRTAKSVSAQTTHTCAVLNDDSVKCWGENGYGNLGLGDNERRGDGPGEMGDSLPTVSLGTGRSAREVAAGWHHTCALLDDASVKCWGVNWSGHLGLGDANDRGDTAGEMGDSLPAVSLGTGLSARAIAVGMLHSCALFSNGAVKYWPRAPETSMGDGLPSTPLGTGRTAEALVASAGSFYCALLDNGTIKCWGDNYYGQLGLGDQDPRSEDGQLGDSLPAVSLW
jgi:cysteine-rich repeat protein